MLGAPAARQPAREENWRGAKPLPPVHSGPALWTRQAASLTRLQDWDPKIRGKLIYLGFPRNALIPISQVQCPHPGFGNSAPSGPGRLQICWSGGILSVPPEGLQFQFENKTPCQ